MSNLPSHGLPGYLVDTLATIAKRKREADEALVVALSEAVFYLLIRGDPPAPVEVPSNLAAALSEWFKTNS